MFIIDNPNKNILFLWGGGGEAPLTPAFHKWNISP